ncbi:MAG: hypothetical protein ACI845_003715 [Gammaproteobacteria bacterium]|jgi:hypothetical protein
MDLLIEQERALHQYEVRQNIVEVSRLIHSDFQEIGVSGTRYDFKSIVEMMQNEKMTKGYIHSQDYTVFKLAPSVYLLLYRSAWVDELGTRSRFARRSSIWVPNGDQWQLKYHQGTACNASELKD